MRAWTLGFGLFICFGLAGCGGNVTVGGTEASGTGGGTSGETGGTAGTGTTASAVECGGKSVKEGSFDEWCDYPDSSVCGCCDLTGVCNHKPLDLCGLDCSGVCGCNGQFYCNECVAQRDGVDIDPTQDCTPGPAYS